MHKDTNSCTVLSGFTRFTRCTWITLIEEKARSVYLCFLLHVRNDLQTSQERRPRLAVRFLHLLPGITQKNNYNLFTPTSAVLDLRSLRSSGSWFAIFTIQTLSTSVSSLTTNKEYYICKPTLDPRGPANPLFPGIPVAPCTGGQYTIRMFISLQKYVYCLQSILLHPEILDSQESLASPEESKCIITTVRALSRTQ